MYFDRQYQNPSKYAIAEMKLYQIIEWRAAKSQDQEFYDKLYLKNNQL